MVIGALLVDFGPSRHLSFVTREHSKIGLKSTKDGGVASPGRSTMVIAAWAEQTV